MKSQLKSCLISRILSLVGAAILLIPVMAHALPPPALMPAAGVHVITTDGTDTRTGTLRMPAAPTGPINVVTPPPSGPCANQVVVSGIHYPNQSCSQTTPGFLSNMMTMFHFTSKCLPPNHLLGVTNVTCQNAPITGFPNGSVYQGTACCGFSPPPVPDLSVTKTCQINGPHSVLCTVTFTNNGTVPSVGPLNFTDTATGPADAIFTGGGSNTGLPFSGSSGAGAITPNICHANFSVQHGHPQDAIFSYKLPHGGILKNCVTLTSPVDSNMANNTNVCTTISVPN